VSFDLNETMRALYEGTKIADPGEFADALIDQIPDASMRDVLRISLRAHVRIWLGQQRMARIVDVEEAPAEQHLSATGTDNASPLSVRQAEYGRKYRGLHFALLQECLSVKSGWKRFGKCTADDVEFIEQDRRTNAARSLARADFYARIRAAMLKASAVVVEDLGDATLSALVSGGDQ